VRTNESNDNQTKNINDNTCVVNSNVDDGTFSGDDYKNSSMSGRSSTSGSPRFLPWQPIGSPRLTLATATALLLGIGTNKPLTPRRRSLDESIDKTSSKSPKQSPKRGSLDNLDFFSDGNIRDIPNSDKKFPKRKSLTEWSSVGFGMERGGSANDVHDDYQLPKRKSLTEWSSVGFGMGFGGVEAESPSRESIRDSPDKMAAVTAANNIADFRASSSQGGDDIGTKLALNAEVLMKRIQRGPNDNDDSRIGDRTGDGSISGFEFSRSGSVSGSSMSINSDPMIIRPTSTKSSARGSFVNSPAVDPSQRKGSYIFAFVYTCIYIHIYMHACMYVYMNISIRIYTYTYRLTHIKTHENT
jgi:hypothetical protein